MFDEDSYEELAELYINLNDCPSDEYLYCLCSRALLRIGRYNEERSLPDDIDSVTNEDLSTIRFLNSSTESHPSTVQTLKKKEQDEGVSCYCSASHCSTDDSTRDAPHSDSGADLSETSRDPEWEEYWAKHGENIIWESWIERYGEYVDQGYSRESKQVFTGALESLGEISHENSDVTRLSFGSEISDSFTNVTALTLSELSTEDSSLMSSSDSAGSVSADAAQWQALWINHFNSQYQLAYENYKSGFKIQKELDIKVNEYSNEESDTPDNILTQRPDKQRNLEYNSVGVLLNHLRSINMAQEEPLVGSDSPINSSEVVEENFHPLPESTSDDWTQERKPLSETSNESELPKSNAVDEFSSKTRATLKRPHEREDDRLRGAFNLIGLSYHGEGVSSGSVNYKKRNIRWQNRLLNMHFHFDEDGQIITRDKETNLKQENNDKWHLANTSEIKSDFSEKDDSSGGDFFSASEESESRKEKRKKRRKRKGLPKEIMENERLMKFWYQRYRLFSKFDEGIKLDEESWYSVSPEKVSQHTAERCRCDLIVDACCGAGGNTIQFAFTCEKVIAIDIDPHKIELAKHNAKIYGVEERIEFIVGDFLQLAPMLHADVVFLSPPWGGLNYSSEPSFHLDKILPPIGGSGLFKAATNITPNVVMYLPRNVNSDELFLLAGPGGTVELEQNFLGKKLIAVTTYFGELAGSHN